MTTRRTKTTAPTSVLTAAKSGDQRRVLEAMRDKLATAMDEADSSVVAQVAARLQAVVQALAALPPAEEEKAPSDVLAERRARRRAAATNVPAPAGRRVKRGG